MWVFCGGMHRSGSTLQFQLTAQLVEEAGRGRRIDWNRPEEFGALRQQYAGDASWKVFKTHDYNAEIGAEFERNNALGVYIFRDIRDVVVSKMRRSDRGFKNLLKGDFLDNCLEQFRLWTALPRVLVSKYETMMADLTGEVGRLAAHLGIELSAERQRQIAAEYSLERQKQRIEEAASSGQMRPGVRKNDLFDPHTQLHANHIGTGEVGGWKEALSSEEVAMLEARTKDWLVACGYELQTNS